jgi:hypothetical protein
VYGALSTRVLAVASALPTGGRVALAAALLLPLGFAMGRPFPAGLRAASEAGAPTAWLWGLNGAASVCASVLAVAIAITQGIQAAFWCGVLSYGLAAVALASGARRIGGGPV